MEPTPQSGVAHEKRLQQRRAKRWQTGTIVGGFDEWHGGGEEAVHDSVARVVDSLDVGDAAVAVDLEIGDL